MKSLGSYTPARVGLGSAGDSLPTKPLLEFRLAHARARDAVHFPLDTFDLCRQFAERTWHAMALHSAAADRNEYLRFPDKGRRLDSRSAAELEGCHELRRAPLVFLIADGLSAIAVQRHAVPLLECVFHSLAIQPDESNPVLMIQQARVGISDHVGDILAPEISVLMIGERPGLSSPDSLGIYLTWQPRSGRTNAERNCISNIHAQGLSYQEAAHRLSFLINESRKRRLSGVSLKESASKLLA